MIDQRLRKFSVAALVLAAALMIPGRTAHAADLKQYISPEFCGVVVIHPQRIATSTLAEAIKSGMPKGGATPDPVAMMIDKMKHEKDVPPGFDADKLGKLVIGKPVHRLMLVLEAGPTKKIPAAGAIIIQFAEDVDGEGIISAISSDWKPADVGGVKYMKLKGPKEADPDAAALAPDSRTLILGMDTSVVKMLAKNEGDRPLLNQLQHASFDNDIVIEYYAPPMWDTLTKTTGQSIDEIMATMTGKNPVAADMVKDLKSVSIQINYSGKTLLKGEIGTGKAETATTMSNLAQQGLAGAKTQFEAMKKNPPPGPAAFILPMVSKVGDEVLANLSIKSEGTQVTIDLPMPDSLPGALTGAAQMFGGMLGTAAKPAGGN